MSLISTPPFKSSLYRRRRTDEVRTLLSVAILLLALVPACSRSQRRTHVWIHPSSKVNEVNRVQEGLRGRSREANQEDLSGRNRPSPRPLRRLRTMAQNTFNDFNDLKRNLPKDLCNKILGTNVIDTQVMIDTAYGLRMLPENPKKWYKKEIKCLSKRNKVEQSLPKLYDGLKQYLTLMKELQDRRWSQHLESDCRFEREKALNRTAVKINQFLTELDRSMRDVNVEREGSWTRKKEEGKLLSPPNGDTTVAHIIESIIMLRYGEFLEEWNKIIRVVVGKKGFKRC